MAKGCFDNWAEVALWLDSFCPPQRRLPSDPGVRASRLERMRLLLGRFGDPQNSFKSIHIAGSKGKGSTAAFIASGLASLGLRTGLYLSPHLTDHRERFTLAGKWFDEPFLLETAALLRDGLEGLALPDGLGSDRPTTFELYTLYAFLLFREARCDWAVVETGLGGRLDATNVLLPQASVLTPIELEHTEVLGHTIALIAAEKSKIIKKGAPVFVSRQTPRARRVFQEEARLQGSPAFFLEDEATLIRCRLPRHSAGRELREAVRLRFRDGFEASLALRMAGRVQAENAALAVLVLHKLGLLDGERGWEEAIGDTFLPGRMEELSCRGTPLFLDGAHTPRSLGSLARTYRTLFPGRGGVCIFCPIQGKDIKALSSIVLSAFDKIIVSKPGSFKKSDPEEVFRTLRGAADKAASGKTIILRSDPSQALEEALSLCEEGQGVLATGSFYLAGAVKEALCRSTGAR